ncbi:hypothetical protein BSLA_03r0060 [Burkholderia stabilis]|nr:hypothetical protein BSLA_03r0060 [Burkholderia stabilis]
MFRLAESKAIVPRERAVGHGGDSGSRTVPATARESTTVTT